MSKPEQESIIKETGDLLEQARNEVLKEINNGKGLFSRIFGDNKNESLKRAQSSISKAINQMQSINKDESSIISKLQKHLNQRTETLNALEQRLSASQKEASELRDKIRLYENEVEKFKAIQSTEVQTEVRPESHKIEEDFKAKIKELEDSNREIALSYRATQDNLKESESLAAEFSTRLKRLKSEITS